MSMRKKGKWGTSAAEATLSSFGGETPRPPATSPQPPPSPQPSPALEEHNRQLLEEQIAELRAAIPEGYSLRFISLDQIRLDRPYDKEPIPESWVESTAQSIADEGLKHPIRLDQSLRVLAGQVRSTALLLLRRQQPEVFQQLFPNRQLPVFVHDSLDWDQDPDACERELLLLQRGRDMPTLKEREGFVIQDAYRSLSDPKALWTSGGRSKTGRYRPIAGLAQRWFMSERHVRNLVKPLRTYIEQRIQIGDDPQSLQTFAQSLPPLESVFAPPAAKERRNERSSPSRGWKHYVYHAHKSANSLQENLHAIASPFSEIALFLAQRLEQYRQNDQAPPQILDHETVQKLQELIEKAASTSPTGREE